MDRREGLKALGRPYDDEALAASFDMPAVVRGFEEVSRLETRRPSRSHRPAASPASMRASRFPTVTRVSVTPIP